MTATCLVYFSICKLSLGIDLYRGFIKNKWVGFDLLPKSAFFAGITGQILKQNFLISYSGKSILQVPDTGTQVLDNTRPFLRSSIVYF